MQKGEAGIKVRKYLEDLWYRVINLDRYIRAVHSVDNEVTEERIEKLGLSGQVFIHFRYLAIFNIVVTLDAIFDKTSKRSICQFLDWLEAYSNGNEVAAESARTLKEKVDNEREEICKVSQELAVIKVWRDKLFAHHDKTYFDNPYFLHEKKPLSIASLETAVEVLKRIVSLNWDDLGSPIQHWLDDDLAIRSVIEQLIDWPSLKAGSLTST